MKPTFEQMNYDYRRAFTLAERGEWAEAEDAYEAARVKAEALGATEVAKQAAAFRDLMRHTIESRMFS